ncbi:hypothetical protein HUT06_33715 [Actinomadura sp. NAK00032]|uniref:hypothetical protein n=1 Tax=Actinomadura sp. NAK00032 TaxID=2742128 RepID=UPI00158FAF41|nr:hypothetical protein [Actinomadura sp. NAK00032]QKW38358.1 hypothetical protein HUT06_33715 [Actinomadura sp. NAK00032]
MRYGVARALAGGVVVLGTLSGCGMLGGNSDEVCADTKKVLQQYITQVRSVPAAEPAQWKQATQRLAGQLEGLGKKADDAALKKALLAESEKLSTAAPAVGTGDVSQLNTVMKETPAKIGKACD